MLRRLTSFAAVLAAVALQTPSGASAHIQASIRSGAATSKGVNLGGWLVTEHWMTTEEAFWSGVDSSTLNNGEYSVISNSSDPTAMRTAIDNHHSTFITEADIEAIAAAGLNTVRVPVGWWIVGFDNSDPSGKAEWKTYPTNTIQYLDTLITKWAYTHNVAVLISFHAAKGSQNGAEHSSPNHPGNAYWSSYTENVANTIEAASFLAARYKNDDAFLGIGLLNEPNSNTDQTVLYQYYEDAYAAIRDDGNDCVLSIMPLLYEQGPDQLQGVLEAPAYTNVWVEWHPYFVWGYEATSGDDLINVSIPAMQAQLTTWNARKSHNRLLMGEWSLATASGQFSGDTSAFYKFATAQLAAMNEAEGGWTFWNWKSSGDSNGLNGWSLRSLVADSTLAGIITA
ncbi:hypothetical protein BBJ28_00016070 [Nothophytophthora sp. Chile5]|nr:hypothetical protein BBJ28_00016070 [Nothophytophthora sp. Chile5]